MADAIACPECGTEIEVTEVLSAQLRQQLRREFEAEAKAKDEQFAAREQRLQDRAEQLQLERNSIDASVTTKVAEERIKLAAEAKREAAQEVAVELQDAQLQLNETKAKLKVAKQTELDLRKERTTLEEEKEALELSVQRRVDEERTKIRQSAKKEALDEHKLDADAKDKLIGDLQKQITELQRKSQEGSQQLQGEVLELELEELLRQHFVHDSVEPVRKGQPGSDVVHTVRDPSGRECGVILWESKRTKAWNDNWLGKLRDDQRAAKADLAVIVSIEVPDGVTTFQLIDGVWVSTRGCALSLAAALRAGLIEVAKTRQSQEGRQGKMELVYNYLAGPAFKLRVEGIAEAFRSLRADLESEKNAYRRLWAKREKQLERALENTAGMYGDLSGIIGNALPAIDMLELSDTPRLLDDTNGAVEIEEPASL